MKYWPVLALALLASLPWRLVAQVQVSAQLDTTQALIGDQVRISISVGHTASEEIIGLQPDVLDSIPELEVIETGPLLRPNAGVTQQEVVVSAFDSGYFRLPSLPVAFRRKGTLDTAWGPELAFRVHTIPVSADSATLQPIKPVIEEPLAFSDMAPFVFGALGALVLIMGLLLFLRRRRGAGNYVEEPIFRPAHAVAMERLEDLRKEQLPERGASKVFFSRLSQVVRTYLEDRFEVPALESTTREIMAALDPGALSDSVAADLKRVLHMADLVKFAKAEPALNEHRQMENLAEQFIATTADDDVLVVVGTRRVKRKKRKAEPLQSARS